MVRMLFVDPFEVEMDDGREKIKIFRVRKSEDRPMYEYSTWGRLPDKIQFKLRIGSPCKMDNEQTYSI